MFDQYLKTYSEGTFMNDFLWVNMSKLFFPNQAPSKYRQLAQYKRLDNLALTSRFSNASERHLRDWGRAVSRQSTVGSII